MVYELVGVGGGGVFSVGVGGGGQRRGELWVPIFYVMLFFH